MKRYWILNFLIAGSALISLAVYIKLSIGSLGDTRFDDAYMITRYAQHWLAGQGFSWNAVDGPAYGIASPAYLLLITSILWLTGCSDGMALTATSWAAGLLSVLVLVILGFLVQKDRTSRKLWMPLLVIPALLVMPPFHFHSLTGMETTFSLLCNSLLACSIVLAARKRTTAMLLLCLFAGFLSYTTRPDNGVYALFLPPLYFIATDRSSVRYSIQYVAIFAVLIACSLIVSKMLYGDYLPLPFFAKANGFHQGYIGVVHWNAMAAMVTFVLVALPFLLVIVSTVSRRTYLQLLAIGVIVAATFSYYITVTQIMGRNARYYYPSLSFVVLAAFVAAFAQADEPRIRITYSNILPRIALGFLIVMAALPGPVRTFSIKMWGEHVIGTPVFVKAKTQYRMAASNPLPQLGWWIGIERMVDVLTCLPQGSIFAASEYGIIASGFPDLVIIDLVGLHDKVIAHRGFSADYVISRKPDLIWFPHGDYTYEVADILDNSSFQKDYEYYPGAYNFGIAIRKDSERYSEIKKVISREFRRIYPWYNLSDYVAVPM